MGLMKYLGMGEEISKPIDAIGNTFDKIFTSDDERLQAEAVFKKLEANQNELQVNLNKSESQHRSLFVSGWRPFIGWTCGISLFIYYVPQFILASIIWIKLSWAAQEVVTYPVSDISGLMELVIGMLGIAGLRTIEKLRGKTK